MTAGGGAEADFELHRPRLFGMAYRMLGSAHDAEDVVQDTYLRWLGADRVPIESPAAWLTTVLTRLCVNHLTSARVRRESYPGPWLPEPVLTPDPMLGPAETAAQRESVSLALLVAMERLSPAERAVYVLREAFGYSHRDVAMITGLSEANCRQLHSRARRRIRDRPVTSSSVDRDSWDRLVERFLGAARDGDLPALESLLAEDVTSWTDGGGAVPAARRPVRGRAAVARYLAGISAGRYTDALRMQTAEVNGAPAMLSWSGGRLAGVFTMEVGPNGDVRTIRLLTNPAKLSFLARRHATLVEATLSRSGGLSGHC